LFVWFEGERFVDSHLKWIWRGERGELLIRDFQH
jgi:hypothetical protein